MAQPTVIRISGALITGANGVYFQQASSLYKKNFNWWIRHIYDEPAPGFEQWQITNLWYDDAARVRYYWREYVSDGQDNNLLGIWDDNTGSTQTTSTIYTPSSSNSGLVIASFL